MHSIKVSYLVLLPLFTYLIAFALRTTGLALAWKVTYLALPSNAGLKPISAAMSTQIEFKKCNKSKVTSLHVGDYVERLIQIPNMG